MPLSDIPKSFYFVSVLLLILVNFWADSSRWRKLQPWLIDTVAGESILNDIVGRNVGVDRFRLNHNFDI